MKRWSLNERLTLLAIVLFVVTWGVALIGQIWIDQPQDGIVYQSPKRLIKLHPLLFDWVLGVFGFSSVILATGTALQRLITGERNRFSWK